MYKVGYFRASVLALILTPAIALYAQAGVAPARQSGTVKMVAGNHVTLTTASGGEVSVTIGADASVLQLMPGSTDLKSATAAHLADVAVGDRVLITLKPGETATALRVILIKSTDIAARNAAQQADWQRRGKGGLVRSIAGPEITIATGARNLIVVTTPKTIFRRYAQDSVKFEDTKTGTLDQIQIGDQLRVRGALKEDRSSITAEEVVSGSFQNLSGAVASIEPAAGTLTLRDLVSKKMVTIKVTANSDLRRLPAKDAAAFATRDHTEASTVAPGSSSRGGPAAAGKGVTGAGPASDTAHRSAGADLLQLLPRLPAEALTDLHVGDAVIIVASLERGTSLTAITLLSGVEQILSATPSGAQPITLSPWDIGTPDGGQ